MLQAGPVSAAHGMFNQDCAKCHTASFQTAKKLFVWSGTVRATPSEACSSCHEGPPHNVNQYDNDLMCAGCHREHRGRPNLARVPDADCTQCHADLKENSKRSDKCPFENVTSFPDGHPPFALTRKQSPLAPDGKDPGQLHFNHHVHLTSPQVRFAKEPKKPLDCTACHQVDAAGRYMQPINYEKHCAECHPLSVRLTGNFPLELGDAVERFAKQPAPHKAPEVVRAELRDRLIRFAQEHRLAPETDGSKLDPDFPKARRMQPVTSEQWKIVKDELAEMEKVRFSDRKEGGM
jgi:hypothetical protein